MYIKYCFTQVATAEYLLQRIINTHTDRQTHTHTNTDANTHTHTHIAQTHTYTHVHVHINNGWSRRESAAKWGGSIVYVCACVCVCVWVSVCVYIYTYKYAYISYVTHARARAHTHTHTHSHTHPPTHSLTHAQVATAEYLLQNGADPNNGASDDNANGHLGTHFMSHHHTYVTSSYIHTQRSQRWQCQRPFRHTFSNVLQTHTHMHTHTCTHMHTLTYIHTYR